MKNISFDFSQEEDPEAIDTVDVDARKNFKGKRMPEVESPVKDRTLGFDLMSLTSRRGHFVDHVSIVTITSSPNRLREHKIDVVDRLGRQDRISSFTPNTLSFVR